MRIRHPYSLTDEGPDPDDAVHYGGRRRMADVDEDGVFEVPDDFRGWLDGYADRYGYSAEDLLVDDSGDTCEAVKTDGEVCGRELPCAYHSEDD